MDLYKKFKRADIFSKNTRIKKLLLKPWIIFSVLIEKVCLYLRFTIYKKVTLFWGDKMQIILPDTVAVALERYGLHEADLTEYLLLNLKKNDVFIDVGAHYGYFSLLARALIRGGAIYAFEPTPKVFELLKQNTAGKNIFVHNVAAWSSNQNINFYDLGDTLACGNTAKIRNDIKSYKLISVPAISLDEHCLTRNIKPTYIKLDVEGAEFEVLKGAEQILKFYKPVIILEVLQEFYGKQTVANSVSAIAFLKNFDYLPFTYDQGLLKSFEYKPGNYFKFSNVIFIHKSKYL